MHRRGIAKRSPGDGQPLPRAPRAHAGSINVSWRADCAGLERGGAALDHPVRNLTEHLLEQIAKMRAAPIIGGSDMAHAVCMGAKLITFPKGGTRRVVGIVNGDRMSSMLPDDSKARHIGWAVADVDHVLERDRPKLGGHVVVDVL